MRWKNETCEQRADRLEQWHRCFAFFPRTIGGTTVWLGWYERRAYDWWDGPLWMYRLVGDTKEWKWPEVE